MKHAFVPLLILFILTGCKKEHPFTAAPAGMNIAPRAFAGADFYIVLPADSTTLYGEVEDAPADIVQHHWQKISGPASCIIERPGSLQTKVSNLVKGTYAFALTVTDKGGLTGRDTVIVNVEDPPIAIPNELIFSRLLWIFPWYASVEVRNIIRYPAPRKVFIQRSFDSTWIEVSYISNSNNNNTYEYFIETRPAGAGMYNYGSLYVVYYGSITNDAPNVKIQF